MGCENMNGIFTQSDAQCHSVPYSHPSCSVNITCTIPCPPRPVPSDSDKGRYNWLLTTKISRCGDVKDSNGHDVSLPEAIFKGGNYHPRGASGYHVHHHLHTVTEQNYLWGGSCKGSCGGGYENPTCTFPGM